MDEQEIPEMSVSFDAQMTPEQLRQFEAMFNDNTRSHRAKFLPPKVDDNFEGGPK